MNLTTLPTADLVELLTAIALVAGLILGSMWGAVLGYLMAQPSRLERRTLRRALDGYLAAGLPTDEAEEAKRLRYSSTLKER